jgi:hypothetical protein
MRFSVIASRPTVSGAPTTARPSRPDRSARATDVSSVIFDPTLKKVGNVELMGHCI